MSQRSAGTSQPGKRQNRSRMRTKSANSAVGRQPGSGSSDGLRIGLMVAPFRIALRPAARWPAHRGQGSVQCTIVVGALIVEPSGRRIARRSPGSRHWIGVDRRRTGRSGIHTHTPVAWLPAASAPSASARRSPMLRGSPSQTPRAIAVTRCCRTAASVASCRPHTVGGFRVVVAGADAQVAAADRGLGAAHGVGVVAGYPDLDAWRSLSSESGRQWAARSTSGGVDQGQGLLVFEQMRAPSDRADDASAQLTFAVQRGDLREAIAQRHRDPHLTRRPPVIDMQGASHLAGRRIPRITCPH